MITATFGPWFDEGNTCIYSLLLNKEQLAAGSAVLSCSSVSFLFLVCDMWCGSYTECPTRYGTRHFFNNSNTNEDIATKFEQEYIHCVRNEEECVCSVCL